MKHTDIEIGMKVIVRPINFATHEQDVTHIWYDKIATVIDIGENPYLEQVQRNTWQANAWSTW